MFVSDEVQLDVSFAAARAGLADLRRGGLLASASADAYDEGVTELVRVGPAGSVPGLARLVEVRFGNLLDSDDHARLALRWEAAGRGSGLFPVLDADVTLSPAGENASVLTLVGVYRPPFGALGAQLDRAIFHRVATATIRGFVTRVADIIARPARAAGHRRENPAQVHARRTSGPTIP